MTYRPKIHVVVPAFNCMEWLPRALDSIAEQTVAPDTVTVIDDASTDPTQAAWIADYCRVHGWLAQLNTANREMPYNLQVHADLLNPDPDDVIVVLDGDDAFTADCVGTVAGIYSDGDVWCSYGSYRYWPDVDHWDNPALPYPDRVIDTAGYRWAPILYNHPLSWRHFLWDRIPAWQLQDQNGRWFRANYDYAVMCPLMELSGRHCHYNPTVLYEYNHTNPLSHIRLADHIPEFHAVADLMKTRQPLTQIPDSHVTNPRAKRDMLLAVRDRHRLTGLVETGTGLGDGLEWYSRHFDTVTSIEIDPESQSVARARQQSAKWTPVQYLLGDSATLTGQVLAGTDGPAVWLLDAHWSGGTKVRAVKDTPLVEELQAIRADGRSHVVVVDDARLCGTDPAYPTVDQIRRLVDPWTVDHVDDFLVIEPR